MPHILYDGFVDDEFSGIPPVIVVVDLEHLEFLRKKIPLVHALREADEDLAGVSFRDYSPQWYKFNIYDSDYEFFENLDGSMIILDELPEELKRLESQYDPEVPNHRISVELPEVSFRGRAPHEINFKCYLKNTQIQIYTGALDLNELDKIPGFKGTERVEE
jgi:hypothetical protein